MSHLDRLFLVIITVYLLKIGNIKTSFEVLFLGNKKGKSVESTVFRTGYITNLFATNYKL